MQVGRYSHPLHIVFSSSSFIFSITLSINLEISWFVSSFILINLNVLLSMTLTQWEILYLEGLLQIPSFIWGHFSQKSSQLFLILTIWFGFSWISLNILHAFPLHSSLYQAVPLNLEMQIKWCALRFNILFLLGFYLITKSRHSVFLFLTFIIFPNMKYNWYSFKGCFRN